MSARDSAGVGAVALAVRVAAALWAWGAVPPTADGEYYQRIAERVAAGQGYTWAWPDGAVTFAAHYPIGYPAALGACYALLGAHPGVAMLFNAVLGALGSVAAHRALGRFRRRGVAIGGGLLVALHPALWAYTPALMTEGVTAALLCLACWGVVVARERGGVGRWLLVGLVLGAATLVRPQCLLLSPAFGFAAAPRGRRRWSALVVTVVTVAVCLPWTARNCLRLHRCALVSVNGGWNLAIGTNPAARGGWAPIEVPPECREVFDEAAKDSCFERAARREIAAHPWRWLGLVPAKLSLTLDYGGAAGWYLHQSSPRRFSAGAKELLGVVETVVQRLVLALALLSWWSRRRGPLIVLGVAAALTPWGFVGYLALVALACTHRGGCPVRLCAAATVGAVVVTHAVFFGAGRYQLPLVPMVCLLAALGAARSASRWRHRKSTTAAEKRSF